MLQSRKSIIFHDNMITEIVDHRKNEKNENIITYLLELYQNIGTYTILQFHEVHNFYPTYIFSMYFLKFKNGVRTNIWVQFQ